MGRRINTVMQPCFFALSGVLPPDQALAAIRARDRGAPMPRQARPSSSATWPRSTPRSPPCTRCPLPITASTAATIDRPGCRSLPPISSRRVTARLLAGEGDLLPVSALPVDGTFPTGTARWEKRALAVELPVWDETICIDCGKCALVCPHAAIRMKVYDPEAT